MDESQPPRILIVDDNPEDRELFRRCLERTGRETYAFYEAGTGAEALRLWRTHTPHCILLDQGLPDLDGLEVLAQVRARQEEPRPAVILLTGQGSEDLAVEAMKRGADEYLVKRRVSETLVPAVSAAVENVVLRAWLEEERRRLEEKSRALRESERRWSLLLEGVRDYAMYLLDPAGRVTSWNVGAERILGYGVDEILGRHFASFYTEEDRRAGVPERALERARKEGQFSEEAWRQRKGGERFWAGVLLSSLRDVDGRLEGFAKIVQDLSGRRRLEDELAAYVEDLQEAARRKDEFLAMLAHELRNPLAPMMNAVYLARLSAADERLRERALDTVSRSARQLSRLISDLLDTTRLSRGRVTLELTRLDVARLLHQTVEDRRRGFEEASLELRAALPPTPVWVEADETRLAQIFQNLLDNSLRFTPPGGSVEVALAIGSDTQEVEIRVTDSGIGIEPALLPRIFDVFAQGAQGLERSRGGLGLGLAVAKALVELHRGRIEAHSAGRNRGAQFRVLLPYAGEPAAVAALPPRMAPAAAALRVLVVEDHADAAAMLQALLGLLGHEARVASSGTEGLELARSWQPDVILCDIGLPGMDGLALARELRRDPATAAARLIAVSGYASAEDSERSLAAGFERHLAKPVEPEVLRGLLAQPRRSKLP